ncbi:MAG: YtxH domain-containing protein [bacterium]|nr:YtxH domain-containing protein [bacterium]
MSGGSFWRGLVFGVLVGMAAAVFVNPQVTPETRARLGRARDGLKQRANRILSRAQQEVDQVIDQVTP